MQLAEYHVCLCMGCARVCYVPQSLLRRLGAFKEFTGEDIVCNASYMNAHLLLEVGVPLPQLSPNHR